MEKQVGGFSKSVIIRILLTVLIVSVRIMQIFIGLPYFADHGHGDDCFFYVTCTKNIFELPDSVFWSFGYWLSFVTSSILTDGSLVQLRVLQCFVDIAIYLLVFSVLKNVFNRTFILVGLLFAAIAQSPAFSEFSCNGYSMLFISLSVFLIFNGLRKKQNVMILLASALLSVNVLVRLPNVLDALFVLLIPLYYYCFEKQSIKESAIKSKKSVIFYFVGYFLGMVVCVILLQCFDHFEKYSDFIRYLFLDKGESAHSSAWVYKATVINCLHFAYFCMILLCVYVIVVCKAFYRWLFIIPLAFFLYKIYFHLSPSYDYRSYLFPFPVLFIATYFVIKNKMREYLYWAIFAFMLFVLFPLGSASPNSFLFPFLGCFVYPITIGTLVTLWKNNSQLRVRFYFIFLLIFIAFVSVFIWIKFPYFFIQDRFKIFADGKMVNNTGIITYASDAESYNKYTSILRSYVENKPVLTTDLFLHATLNVKPFAIFVADWENKNPDRLLQKAYEEQKEMPVIVLYKNDKNMRKLLFSTNFIKNACYKEVYSDEIYQIYKSNK
ncbi:MAG: hypothetical protein J6M59_02990 [Bacteroidaceae bacterium]|nr:hypothetical protein [Bacteroidaceae bacterium]